MVEKIGGGLALVIGGAASGKSAFAESLACATGRPRIYIATAEAYDAEMRSKIADHKAQRGPDWTTIEAPLDLAGALAQVQHDKIVLIDCLTLWLSNQLLSQADLDAETTTLRRALAACPAPIVAVSNETGMGLVPDTALGRAFRNAQGRLNQQIAADADRVAFVAAGLPLWLKGAP
jgi:adenosylcobinamide kinase/adenosylcobinamide-phosphate guanylyltransferase